MASVITTKDFPGLVAGSVLTLVTTSNNNRYVAANGTWFDAANVAAHPDTFLSPLVSGLTWFVANADGTTGTVTGIPNVTGIKPNYFATLASAQAAAAASLVLMSGYKK